MNAKEQVQASPEGTLFPRAVVLKLLDDPGAPAVLTTKDASRWYGYSPKSWLKWCRDGSLLGAWQDEAGGPWRLPREGCERKLAALKLNGKRHGLKGPRRSTVQAGALLEHRRPSIWREA